MLRALYLQSFFPIVGVHQAAILSVVEHFELCYVLLHRPPFVHAVLVVDVAEECQCGPSRAVSYHRTPIPPQLSIAEPGRVLELLLVVVML